MGDRRIVIGAGPDALRAAAVLAHGGHQVTLLQEASTFNGVDHPEIPLGTGRIRVPAEARATAEEILGALVEAPDLMRGVVKGGTIRRLPLSPWEVGQYLESSQRLPAFREWARRRSRNRMHDLLGGGQEERTYRDWVERRMGGPAYEHLYRAWAENRWGASAETLSVTVARSVHGRRDVDSKTVAGGGPEVSFKVCQRLIEDAGGQIIVGAKVTRLVVEQVEKDRRIVAVEHSDGRIPVADPRADQVWVARSPRVVASWLGDQLDASLHFDAEELICRDLLQVTMRGETDGLPEELHVLDQGAPFYRAVTPYGHEKTIVFHSSLGRNQEMPPKGELVERFSRAAEALGIGRFGPVAGQSADTVLVQRVVGWHPVWTQGTHSRYRRVMLNWQDIGLVGVGRAGSFTPLDPGEEVQLGLLYRDEPRPNQHEVHRALLDPPVLLDDLFSSSTRLMER
jgi:hypothetical protein